ncbi:MAG TPA: hypothetical protein VGU69_14815 [Rhizomicrobium sp.]|nr:hypothetical protein [Rhizomicrobium sp.]
MQLSAANLIIASQQSARAQAQPAPDAGPQFTAALKANNVETSDFEPMTFKQATPAAKADSPATTPSAPGYGQSPLLGGTIDIRV